MRYGSGWHWQQYGRNHAALVPMSTAYESPSIRWQHTETCSVDRMTGLGCNCETKETKETTDAED